MFGPFDSCVTRGQFYDLVNKTIKFFEDNPHRWVRGMFCSRTTLGRLNERHVEMLDETGAKFCFIGAMNCIAVRDLGLSLEVNSVELVPSLIKEPIMKTNDDEYLSLPTVLERIRNIVDNTYPPKPPTPEETNEPQTETPIEDEEEEDQEDEELDENAEELEDPEDNPQNTRTRELELV